MAADTRPGARPAPGEHALSQRASLRRLARAHAVRTSYIDVRGRKVEASDETLIAVLDALDAGGEPPIEPAVAPVVVAWDGKPPHINGLMGIELEDGTQLERMPNRLPPGYHEAAVRTATATTHQLVISAPKKLPPPEGHAWGIFLPLYALRTGRDWGAGSFSGLRDLIEWTSSLGGRIVATLPMLAQLYDDPFEPSPYSPASRLFGNELYVDLDAAAEADSPQARQLLSSARFREAVAQHRASDLVDYASLWALKRQALDVMAPVFFEGGPPAEFVSHLRTQPDLLAYARFRATCEARGPARSWRSGDEVDADDPRTRVHLYAQWLVHEQLSDVAATARERGSGLYLDMPLGVSASGFDAWRYRDSFSLKATGGAPPDSFFTEGQDWGFPPMHPRRLRKDGYRYVRATISYLLRYATVLRVDHVMGLHRMYWIPEGLPASRGAYVEFPASDLYAILLLEASRAGATVVGEDLGTVPPEVRRMMSDHRLHRSYVVQYEAQPDSDPVLGPPPRESMASPNTHDMWPFTAWWRGTDIADRVSLGILPGDQASSEHRRRAEVQKRLSGVWGVREDDPATALDACLAHLASSDAATVIVTMEDLWGEVQPQNVPGTTTEYPSWRRRARLPFEAFRARAEVLDRLAEVDRRRRERGNDHERPNAQAPPHPQGGLRSREAGPRDREAAPEG